MQDRKRQAAVNIRHASKFLGNVQTTASAETPSRENDHILRALVYLIIRRVAVNLWGKNTESDLRERD